MDVIFWYRSVPFNTQREITLFDFQLFLAIIDRLIPTYTTNGNLSNLFSIVVINVSLVLSLLELIAFYRLTAFNKKMYKKYLNNKSNPKNNYTLNERYRQLENVYTGKQLAPSFFFHFINILCTDIIAVAISYFNLTNETIGNLISFGLVILAICKLCIEVTVITFHPVLNKNLNKIITTIINFIKCGHSSNKINVEKQTVINLQQNVAASKEQDLHFEMLKQSWM